MAESGRDPLVELGRRRRHPRQVVVEQLEQVTVAERRPAGRELVQRGAERVQVGPLVGRAARAAALLGGEVGERADDLARVDEGRALLGEGRGEVVVDEQRLAARLREHDVRGVDVLVQHASAVDGGDDAGDRQGQLDELGELERGGARSGERHRVAVLHHDRVRNVHLREPRDTRHAIEALQDLALVPEPLHGVRAEGLLADDAAGAAGEVEAVDAGLCAVVEDVLACDVMGAVPHPGLKLGDHGRARPSRPRTVGPVRRGGAGSPVPLASRIDSVTLAAVKPGPAFRRTRVPARLLAGPAPICQSAAPNGANGPEHQWRLGGASSVRQCRPPPSRGVNEPPPNVLDATALTRVACRAGAPPNADAWRLR